MALSVGKDPKMISEGHQEHISYQIPSRQNEVVIHNPGNLLTSSLKDPASQIFNDTYTESSKSHPDSKSVDRKFLKEAEVKGTV